MIDITRNSYSVSPYWRWRKYGTYYSSYLIETIMPTRENYDNFKPSSKTS